MEKLVVALVLYSWLAMSSVYGTTVPENNVNQWLDSIANGKIHEKVTHLKLYMQETLSGPNATVAFVAQGPETNKSATMFGLVTVVDNLLTETPDPKSKPIGQAQGLVSFSSQDELAILNALNFVFTGGEFSGSSLTVLGRNPLLQPLRENPIVGGTGVFRLARGFVTTRTLNLNITSSNRVYEYNIFAIHY